MSVNFLLQATRILHIGNCDDTELRMIYDYLRNLDNDELFTYYISNSVIQYSNDLEFCVEIMDTLIKLFESKEEYEKCHILLNKKTQATAINEKKLENHECI